MSLKKAQLNETLYLSKGKIIVLTNQKPTDTNTVIEKNGKYYDTFDSLTGKLIKAEVLKGYNEGEYDIQLHVHSDKIYKLRFSLNSGYFVSLGLTMKNINISKEVEIIPSYKEVEKEGEKKKETTIFIKQPNDEGDFEIVKRFYSKDIGNYDSLPQPKEVELKGKKHLDYTDRDRLLCTEMISHIETGSKSLVDESQSANSDNQSAVNDKLPF